MYVYKESGVVYACVQDVLHFITWKTILRVLKTKHR